MRKLVLAAACSLVALVGVAPPAHAKGPMVAVLEAPGAAPVVLRPGGDADDPFYELQRQVGYWTAMSPTMGSDGGMIVTEPAGDLGPSVRLTWDQPEARGAALRALGDVDPEAIEHQPPSLVQELYPWADGGPVAFVAGGQTTFDEPSVATWYRIDDDLATTLAELGVDAPTVHAAAGREAQAVAAAGKAPTNRPGDVGPDPVTDDGVPWSLVAGGIILVTAAIGGGGAWARRRRERVTDADAGLPPTGAAA